MKRCELCNKILLRYLQNHKYDYSGCGDTMEIIHLVEVRF